MNPFVEQHRGEIGCVLSCFDRVVITGTLPDICHARALASYLGRHGIRLFDFSTRIQGTPIRHQIGRASMKVYDKVGIVARVECAANDVSFFKHHRHVEQRNGETVFKLAPLRKSIYSLGDLR